MKIECHMTYQDSAISLIIFLLVMIFVTGLYIAGEVHDMNVKTQPTQQVTK